MTNGGFRIPRWASGALVAATLGIAIWMVARDLPSLDTLRLISGVSVAVILVLQLVQLVPESYRQRTVIESSASASIRWFPWFRIFTVGRFLNTLVPQSGNAYRAIRLRSEFDVAFADFGGGMIAFVIMSLVSSLLVAAPFIAWQSPTLTIGGIPASVALLLAAVAAAALPLVVWIVDRRSPETRRDRSRLAEAAHSVTNATLAALTDLRSMAVFLGAWTVTLVVVVALYQRVFDSIGWNLGIGEAIAIYALLQASTVVVLTPGNLGIQELGLAALAALFGIPAAVGVLAAALIRVTGWFALALPAAVFGSRDIIQFLRKGDQSD